MAVPGPAPELRWPHQLVEAALEGLRAARAPSGHYELLLEEALADSDVLLRFRAIGSGLPFDYEAWSTGRPSSAQQEFISELRVDRSRRRPTHADGSVGQSRSSSDPLVTMKSCLDQWLADWVARGYYDGVLRRSSAFSAACSATGASLVELYDVLHLSNGSLWRNVDDFLANLERLHHQAERPRARVPHLDHFHYSEPDPLLASSLFRWRVNECLNYHGIPRAMVLTANGDVRFDESVADEMRAFRSDLALMPQTQLPEVEHALSLFHRPGATLHDKRSACVALAGVLEDRRSLLKDSLLRRDEAALFRIANQFSIRHQNSLQQGDYEEAFLDWIFWTFLATAVLSERLLDR